MVNSPNSFHSIIMKVASSMVWQSFVDNEQLTEAQGQQFKRYKDLLLEWNKRSNLTRITDESAIIQDHFSDSIQLRHFINFGVLRGIADVGSGGGFPGIPLKILFPKLFVVLIEVNQKKVKFLHEVCKELVFENVEIYDNDWRTFLRITHYPVDVVCARASLQLDALVRMFKANCPYNKAQLVYWASQKWQMGTAEKPFFKKEESYRVGNKRRRYIFFSNGA